MRIRNQTDFNSAVDNQQWRAEQDYLNLMEELRREREKEESEETIQTKEGENDG